MAASPQISLTRCLLGAFALPLQRRAEYLRALAVPLSALLALIAVWQLGGDVLPKGMYWLVWGLYAVLLTMAAVRVHRIVLLGAPTTTGPTWSRLEWRYLVLLAALWMVWAIGFMLVSSVLLLALPIDHEGLRVPMMLATLPAAWLVGRLLLVLPAAAIGRDWDLARAWAALRGNGWRLAIVGVGVPWLVKQSVLLAYRDDATLAEWWLLAAINTMAVAVQVTAVSLAFAQIDPAEAGDPETQARETPRWLRGTAPVLVLLMIGAALVARPYLGSSCLVEASSRSNSPDGRFELEYKYVTCRDEPPRAELWLTEGRRAVRLHSSPVARDASGKAPTHPAGGVVWHWQSATTLEIARPSQAANSDGPPQFAGVDIVYRDAASTLPPTTRP